MTEMVDKHAELMTEELEEMQRIKLYTAEEIRILMIKRKNFEHKINASTKELKSFTDYIDYEQELLRNIRKRRDKRNIIDKKGSIENKIIRRIKNLYEIAFQRFPDDIPLLSSFLKFCKQINRINNACDVVSNMLKKHSGNPKIWLVAANWHANDRKDVTTAITTLLKAVAVHKDNKKLYLEMIKIELFEATNSNVSGAEEKVGRQKLSVEKLEKIISTIFQNINDYSFHVELLQVLEKYAFTMKVQETIIEHLLKYNSDDENVWHVLAQRERNDFNVDNESNLETSATPRRTPKARLEACFAKYKEGLSKVSPEVKPKLWLLYVDFLFKLQQEGTGAGTVLKLKTLKSALNEMSEEGHLTEKHYIMWLKIEDDENKTLDTIKRGIRAHPSSVNLWLLRLRYEIEKNDIPSEVDKVFRESAEALKEEGLPLWLAILRYHYLTSDDKTIEQLYQEGIRQPQEISNTLKPQYLEWLLLKKGISAARNVYRTLSTEKPHCKELHAMMLKLESMQIEFNYEEWSDVHQLACMQFGHKDVDVWINYIEFYLRYHKKNPNTKECVEQIRKQAMETLSNELLCLFETKFDIVRASA